MGIWFSQSGVDEVASEGLCSSGILCSINGNKLRTFETTYWSHLQGSSSPVPWTAWPLTVGPVGCPETLATYYQSTPCKISEGWRSHLNYSGNMKSPNIQVLWYVMPCQLVNTILNWTLLWVVKFSGKYITEHVYLHVFMRLPPISQIMN